MKRAERVIQIFLVLTALAAIGFIAVYVTSNDTQLLGLSLGLAFLFVAGAAIVAGKRLVDQRKAIEERSRIGVVASAEDTIETLDRVFEGPEGTPPAAEDRITRRRLVLTAAGAAGALGAAIVVPIASIGTKVGDKIVDTPWESGKRLVDDKGNPLTIDDIAIGTFLPAFPEDADKRDLGSPLVVVRVSLDELDLPADRADWAPEGVLAFSRICPHAGCAISLFRYPLYQPTSPFPALVCPCHYSTFDVRNGGERVFGPAGRRLPQLPIALDGRFLVATGELSEPPGPSYLSVRRWKPDS